MVFHGLARLGEADRNPLKVSQLAPFWTPRARTTAVLGRDSGARLGVPAGLRRAPLRERDTRPAAAGEKVASVPTKCIFIHIPGAFTTVCLRPVQHDARQF